MLFLTNFVAKAVSVEFVTVGNFVLGQKIFNIAMTEIESTIEPDGVTDDFRKETVMWVAML